MLQGLKRWRCFVLGWGLLAGLLSGLSASAAVCPPVDEGVQDLDFARFRVELLHISGRRDAQALLKYVDPEIKFSFGAENGRELFARHWKLSTQPAQSEFWPIFSEILGLGGRFEKGNPNLFMAPYSYVCETVTDAFSQSVVMGRKVVLRAGPTSKARVVAALSHEVVTVLKREGPLETLGGEQHPWLQVRTAGGQTGYIWGKYLRSPLDYRAGFRKQHGKWQMDFFIAGD